MRTETSTSTSVIPLSSWRSARVPRCAGAATARSAPRGPLTTLSSRATTACNLHHGSSVVISRGLEVQARLCSDSDTQPRSKPETGARSVACRYCETPVRARLRRGAGFGGASAAGSADARRARPLAAVAALVCAVTGPSKGAFAVPARPFAAFLAEGARVAGGAFFAGAAFAVGLLLATAPSGAALVGEAFFVETFFADALVAEALVARAVPLAGAAVAGTFVEEAFAAVVPLLPAAFETPAACRAGGVPPAAAFFAAGFLVGARAAAVAPAADGCSPAKPAAFVGATATAVPEPAVLLGDEAFFAMRTSAAIISSLGRPETGAMPGRASSTPRRSGSSAFTTKTRSSPRFSTSRALRGAGSAMFASGTYACRLSMNATAPCEV